MSLNRIRKGVKSCRNFDNDGCLELIKYRERCNVKGAEHPLNFQIVDKPKIMIIGAVPGSIDAGSKKAGYQRLADGQFSLGHRSAQGLGEIMARVGDLKGIDLPTEITALPITNHTQEKHLLARHQLALHVTNLVKCNAPTRWEKENFLWHQAATACQLLHLTNEVETTDPKMIILLGKEVASFFSYKEGWERDSMQITAWVDNATELPFYGNNRFVTAWAHPGGQYFWIQGRKFWDNYASQMAEFL